MFPLARNQRAHGGEARAAFLLGAQLSVNSCDMHKTKIVPGVHAAIQAGFRLSRHFEIYAEPAAVVHAKSIDQVKDQEPANGELKFSIGTKFHF